MEKFLSNYSDKSKIKKLRRGLELFIEFFKLAHGELEDKSNSEIMNVILDARRNDLTPRPDESIAEQRQRASRFEKMLEAFNSWMLKPVHTINRKQNQAYNIRSARANTLGILELFRHYNMPIVIGAENPPSKGKKMTNDLADIITAMNRQIADLTCRLERIEESNKQTAEDLKWLANTQPIIYALLKKDYKKAKQLIDKTKAS
jgi:hypothetical protein